MNNLKSIFTCHLLLNIKCTNRTQNIKCTNRTTKYSKCPKSECSDFGRLRNGSVVKLFGLPNQTSKIRTKPVPNRFGTGFVQISDNWD